MSRLWSFPKRTSGVIDKPTIISMVVLIQTLDFYFDILVINVMMLFEPTLITWSLVVQTVTNTKWKPLYWTFIGIAQRACVFIITYSWPCLCTPYARTHFAEYINQFQLHRHHHCHHGHNHRNCNHHHSHDYHQQCWCGRQFLSHSVQYWTWIRSSLLKRDRDEED